MEIEHINEDTIRVRINNTDLEARGYTFLDLLGNQEQIEEFFYSILDEVDLDNEFKESEAVTFQVMPDPNGLELLISKNPDIHDDITGNAELDNLDDLFLGQEEMVDDNDLLEDEDLEDEDNEEKVEWKDKDKKMVAEFNLFEQMIQLAQTVETINGFSNLYQYNDKYYLDFHLIRNDFSLRTFEEEIAIILEYGGESKLNSDVLAEHAELLIEDDALESIYHYFK